MVVLLIAKGKGLNKVQPFAVDVREGVYFELMSLKLYTQIIG